ncbi:alpha-N-arabinofuranosidase [Pseudactinotalea sp.]|uniref:alpha-N-arabinofuranosidase n=1 Tax=Pseudactinotalea sp. TaxID=1926260 RepID=UPI003B3AC7DD
MAQITVTTDRVIGQVDRRIFGGFIENEGRAIDGGVYEPGSPFADESGVRTDTRDAIAGLSMPVLRWPGGNFVSAYHWVDGVGPREARPSRWDPAWGAVERNQFGTDEFMTYCADLGTEPYLCFNMGTGTLDEAMAWLEYCNGTEDTHWANLRRQHGREEPYGVTYWGLGNEMWGDFQIGHLTAQEYAAKAKRWALALKRVDPTIQLVACGRDGLQADWDAVVIEALVKYVDWYSMHIYTGSDDHWSNVLQVHQVDRALDYAGALIAGARYRQGVEHPVHITYDEWNTWFATRNDRRRGELVQERHTLSDALAVATYLNIFVRRSDVVKMANLAQVVNVLAPIVTGPDGVLKQAIYHPFAIAAAHTQDLAVDTYVECPSYAHTVEHNDRWKHTVSDLGPFPVLDVAATRSADGTRLVVSVINRDPESEHRISLVLADTALAGNVTVRTISGPHPLATNEWDAPDVVGVQESALDGSGNALELTVGACSYVQIDAPIGAHRD